MMREDTRDLDEKLEAVNRKKQKDVEPTKTTRERRSFSQWVMDVISEFVRAISAILRLPSLVLAWVGGCDLDIIKTQPTSEVNKKASLGFAVIAAGSIAGIAGGYAAHQYFGVPMLIGGFVWAMFIVFAIDRPIIVFMDNMKAKAIAENKPMTLAGKSISIVTRIAIVFVASFLTSKMLEIKIFETEVNNKIELIATLEKDSLQVQKYAEIDSLQGEIVKLTSITRNAEADHVAYIDDLYDAYKDAEAIVIELQKELVDEVQGEVGSGKVGEGPAANAIKLNIVAAQAKARELKEDYENAQTSSLSADAVASAKDEVSTRKESLEKKIELVEKDLADGIAKIDKNATQGFLDQYLALEEVAKDAWILMWAVMGLIMLVELLPVILKLISGTGNYEESLALQYRRFAVEKRLKEENEILDINVTFTDEKNILLKKSFDAQETSMRHESTSLENQIKETALIHTRMKKITKAEIAVRKAQRDSLKKEELDILDSYRDAVEQLDNFMEEVETSNVTTREFKESLVSAFTKKILAKFDIS